MKFEVRKLIRFHHCDPAGIVFYPQFFYLLHEVQEDFLTHIGHPEHDMIARGVGVPIVDLKTGFVGMCRFGDEVIISLSLFRMGTSSIGMHYEIHSGSGKADRGQSLKLHAKAVVVYSQLAHGKALEIPASLRAALQPYLETQLEDKA